MSAGAIGPSSNLRRRSDTFFHSLQSQRRGGSHPHVPGAVLASSGGYSMAFFEVFPGRPECGFPIDEDRRAGQGMK
jgi:hypothetical protein